jgi:N-acetylglucosamine kinase-like BadF-type ATPase
MSGDGARFVIAVDGGNSKTDLALVRSDGELVAHTRGAGSSPHYIGTPACLELIGGLLEEARAQAQLDHTRAAAAVLFVAGADLESEEEELRALAAQRDWADVLEVGNDTLAVLRAGADSGIGVAVTCGTGINAVARAPDGRRARFASLGAISGDWGGGTDLGIAALGKAVRAEDGRGRATLLAKLVPAHFALASGEQVAFAVHHRELDSARLAELAPVVLAAADAGDEPAIELRERLAEEIVAFVRAGARRVLSDLERFDVVLGGGVLANSNTLAERVIERLHSELPAAAPHVSTLPPVVGSALLGLDLIGADERAHARLRAHATDVFSADRSYDQLAGARSPGLAR